MSEDTKANEGQTTPPAGDPAPTEPTTPPTTPETPPTETKPEETTPTTPPATPPATPPVTDTKPELSEDQVTTLKDSITKDVSGKVSADVSKSVIQKIGEALGLSKKEEEELPKDAEGLNKLIGKRVKEELSKAGEKTEEDQKVSAKERQGEIDTIIKGWHAQYAQLSKTGKVPAIANPNDINDPGVIARRKVILAIGKMIEKNKAEGVTLTPSVSDVLLASPNVLTAPPGANLPISGDTQSTENTTQFSNKEITKKSFAEIAAGSAT